MPTSSEVNYFEDLIQVVQHAIEEDIGSGDITAQLVPESQTASAIVVTRENAVVCGRPWFNEVFRQIDPDLEIAWQTEEGESVEPGQQLVQVQGNARAILTAERCALNFLQTLMSTATSARLYANKVQSQVTQILDTRKTIPGLRLAQKYAVNVGGCKNHRIGLYDAFLIKENHIAACGSIEAAISKAREISPEAFIEVEVESIDELRKAIHANADRVMLDNFSIDQIKEANKLKTPQIKYEVSGNITDAHLSTLSECNVDHISSGALTKNIKAIDLSMRLTVNS